VKPPGVSGGLTGCLTGLGEGGVVTVVGVLECAALTGGAGTCAFTSPEGSASAAAIAARHSAGE
jgi:hypothetical protein